MDVTWTVTRFFHPEEGELVCDLDGTIERPINNTLYELRERVGDFTGYRPVDLKNLNAFYNKKTNTIYLFDF